MIKSYNRIFKEAEDEQIDFETAIKIGNEIGVDFNKVSAWNFWKGCNIELEHGDKYPATDVIPDINGHDNYRIVGKIVMAHLNEFQDYYRRLIDMERQAKSEK